MASSRQWAPGETDTDFKAPDTCQETHRAQPKQILAPARVRLPLPNDCHAIPLPMPNCPQSPRQSFPGEFCDWLFRTMFAILVASHVDVLTRVSFNSSQEQCIVVPAVMPSFLPRLMTLVCSSVLLVSRLVDRSGTLVANVCPSGAPNPGKWLPEMGEDCVHGAVFIGVIDNAVSCTVWPPI